MAETYPLRVLIAHGVAEGRDTLQKALQELRYEDVYICGSGVELVETSLRERPDLIITSVELPELDGISALLKIGESEPIPAIVVTQERSLELVKQAIQDHVMAYLLEPIKRAEILPTIYLVLHRFEQFQELRREVQTLKQALVDRKIIERAKGALMLRASIDEDAAYKRLRRMATDHRIRMAEAAERVLNSDLTLGD